MGPTKPYEEIVDFFAAHTRPESLVAFRPSEQAQRRVAELVAKNSDNTISTEEQAELDDYLQVEHILILAKARARQHAQLAE